MEEAIRSRAQRSIAHLESCTACQDGLKRLPRALAEVEVEDWIEVAKDYLCEVGYRHLLAETRGLDLS